MTSNMVLHKQTRRTFLKATAATGALVAVGDKLFGGPMSSLVESAAAAAPVTEDKWIHTACWYCSAACGILVHRVNGVVVGVKGNPQCSKSQGRLCVRGNANIYKLYNPYRIKAPMKRTNPEKARYNPETDRWEGVDPGWVEITWDEALDTVAAKLRAVREKDPRRFMSVTGWGLRIDGSRNRDFAKTFPTPNSEISGAGGLVCAASRHTMAYIVDGTSIFSADEDRSNYQINVGGSCGVNKGGVKEVRGYWEQKERGKKFVVIDPRLSVEAAKADEWISIKPLTDRAFVLAMNNVLLNELGIYDEEFMKERSNAPYLIGPDGFYVRSKTELYEDAVRHETLGKPLIWDPTDDTAKTWDDETVQDFALEGTYTVDGVQCHPGFQLMREHYKQFTPEWAANICGTEPALIRRIASEFGEAAQIGSTITIDGHVFPYRPVTMDAGRGMTSHRHGMHDCMAYYHTSAIVGAVAVPGGIYNQSTRYFTVEGDGVHQPGGLMKYKFEWPPHYGAEKDFWPICYKAFEQAWQAILEPEKFHIDYPIEVCVWLGVALTTTFASLDTSVQAIAKIPFSYSIAYHYNQEQEMCDILLPDGGTLEWLHLTGDNLRQPVLEKPLYNTRLPEQITLDLAERVGFLPDYLKRFARAAQDEYAVDVEKVYTWEEILDRKLRTAHGDQYGLEWFKGSGVAPPAPANPKRSYGYYLNKKMRYPVYFDYLKWCGEKLKSDLDAVGVDHVHPDPYSDYTVLPNWRPGPVLEAPAEYDLYVINWKCFPFSMGLAQDNPWLNEIAALHDPYVTSIWMNRATAESKGFKDGDTIWVESYNTGKRERGEILVSEGIHPEAIAIAATMKNWSKRMNPDAQAGMLFNNLISYTFDKWVDPVSGGIETAAAVKVYKA